MDQVINILLGAVIASIVPVLTLIINQRKWKIDKKIELLRTKHDRLEVMYSDILSRVNDAIASESWPSDMTSKISVYGSDEVRKTYFDFIFDTEKDDLKKRAFYLALCLSCNKHLLEVQKSIESNLD